MGGCLIENLHLGMNLRDPAAAITSGEVGLTLGCDFSVPGEVKPMREGLLDQTLPAAILDACDIYLEEVKYRFTTHADGLRVTVAGVVTLIDAAFTGLFKVLPINNEYVVLANATLNKKWKPGWATTQTWGLNTPPLPTLAAGAAGNLTGDYQIAVAYQNDQGNYGPFTAYTAAITLAAQKLDISDLTPDTDTQTTKRRIAVLGGSLIEPMVTYLNDNTSTTLEYNELDASLTTLEQYFNNHKPPVGIVDMASIQGRIFCVTGDNNLFYSLPLFYEAFPLANYLNLAEGENFRQVAESGSYVAVRGKGQEYLVQLTGSDPAFWQPMEGTREGAVSSRFLLTDPASVQVWASKSGFYAPSGYYLPKIDPVVADFSQVFGALAGKKAYLAFEDTGDTWRVMRIDYSLNRPVAHYVSDMHPAAIFADPILDKVYYALGTEVYEFDAGSDPLPTLLTTPEQLCTSTALKNFVGLSYDLSGDSISLSLTLDRVAVPGTLTLTDQRRGDDAPTFPDGLIGGQMGLVLSSTTADWVLYLPLEIVQVAV